MRDIKEYENIIYSEEIGKSGMLDLYVPDQSNQTLLVYFHGGGFEAGDKDDQKAMYREFAEYGYIVVSANYRMYPDAAFPDYVVDAAAAVAWVVKHAKEYTDYKKLVVGGISAGSYLSLMIHFNKEYLKQYDVDESVIDGYVFDAGQPTTHYNVLRERGEDTTAIRIDDAAPLYYLTGQKDTIDERPYLIIVSENDIPGRKEQNELLIRAMETHQYNSQKIVYQIVPWHEHATYTDELDENGTHPYVRRLDAFMREYVNE